VAPAGFAPPNTRNVRRADLLRDVEPFAQLVQLLVPQFSGCCASRTRVDAEISTRFLYARRPQRQQVIIGRAGSQYSPSWSMPSVPVSTAHAYQIFIRHRLGLERLSVRVGDQARSDGPLREAPARVRASGTVAATTTGSGSTQELPACHRLAPVRQSQLHHR